MTINGKTPENLEEQAISLVGTDIYEKLIKDYTEKQWGKPTTELPAFIIRRLPVCLTYDNNYFYSSKISSNHVSFHLQPQNTVLSNLRLAS